MRTCMRAYFLHIHVRIASRGAMRTCMCKRYARIREAINEINKKGQEYDETSTLDYCDGRPSFGRPSQRAICEHSLHDEF